MNPNFSLADWLDGWTDFDIGDVPERIDRYRPGHIKWGSNPNRGRGIQRSRSLKAMAANIVHFERAILPDIANKLNPGAWRGIAQCIPEREDDYMKRGSFVRYTDGTRSSWVHPELEPDKCAFADAHGYRIVS